MYNTTNITNAADISSLAVAANQVTNGALFSFFLLAVFIVLLLAMKRYDFLPNFIVSSWIMFVISIIFLYGGLGTIWLSLVFAAFASLGALVWWTTDRT